MERVRSFRLGYRCCFTCAFTNLGATTAPRASAFAAHFVGVLSFEIVEVLIGGVAADGLRKNLLHDEWRNGNAARQKSRQRGQAGGGRFVHGSQCQ